MHKTIMVFVAVSITAYGMSYTQLKKATLKHAKVLQSQALNVQKTQEKNALSLRTANPTLDLEVSSFGNPYSDKSYGFAIGASQTIRTNSYLEALKHQAKAQTLLAQAYQVEGKARYLQTLELLYSEYAYKSAMLSILKKELSLSDEITRISKGRYLDGSEAKVRYLEAKTRALKLKSTLHTSKREIRTLHYQLLTMAGLTRNVPLAPRFIYPISKHHKRKTRDHSKSRILKAKEKLYDAQTEIAEQSYTSYNLRAGIEKEPDQSILRVGVSIPLPLRHHNEEEKALNKIKLRQLKLDRAQLAEKIDADKKIYRSAIEELSTQYHALKMLLKEEKAIASLRAEGYKIAQSSLLELVRSRKDVLETKKSMLQTQKESNYAQIHLRLLQGGYHD